MKPANEVEQMRYEAETSHLQYLIENQQQTMKKYKVITPWHGFKVGELLVDTEYLRWEKLDSQHKVEEFHTLSIAEATKQGIVEPIEDKPDWRLTYEKQCDLLFKSLYCDSKSIEARISAKLDAYLKILCYVEWANEGKEWEFMGVGRDKIYYTIEKRSGVFNSTFYKLVYSHDLVILKTRADADAMLEIPELVEALNILFNVEK